MSELEATQTALGPLVVSMKSGDEKFQINGDQLELDVRSFWRWGASDLVENTMRGVLAEFIVASALGLVRDQPRQSWSRFDLLTDDGLKIEVKSAAYLQSWGQKKLSSIEFRYGARLGWDPKKGYDGTPSRYADVYVFALLAHEDKPTVDPLDLDQWRFYVATTEAIAKRTRSQYAISLKSLEKLCNGTDQSWQGPVGYLGLESIIHDVVATQQSLSPAEAATLDVQDA